MAMENTHQEQPQNSVPDRFPALYVGIGASAGGLEALEEFFMNMPADSGLAFVVIQHLSPDYKSLMVELLSKRTQMPVFRAEDGLDVCPNTVYLIPPKKNLKIFHGKLLLSEQDYSRGINLPIDVFLRSLADDQGDKAVGIILSGTGSDGMRGIRSIKEAGGMVMVQSQSSAKFDGMPRSAISTGLSDFILTPEEMPDQLLDFAKHPYVTKANRSHALLTDEDGLARIFSLLRERHKVDFTYYKPNTVVRRIERRMTVNKINDLRDYVAFLESRPGEVVTLYRELLIGVTSFFRDSVMYDVLSDKILPELFERKNKQDIRFWVAGCSTGEEAYSLAIVCKECMARTGYKPDVKIFATDVDQDALMQAGNGIYPESITADLSTDLLGKYFLRKEDNYHISRELREMVVFAQQNVIKDPPFTNIDLISCRNLLIYLQPVLQKKVLNLFNFSLNPKGTLILGTSETTGDMSEYFELIHNKFKIYRSKGKRRPINDPSEFSLDFSVRERGVPQKGFDGTRGIRRQEEDRLFDRFLSVVSNIYIPLSIIINEKMELVHVLGDTSGFFKIPSGKVQNDVTKMVCGDLAIPLSTGTQKAFKQKQEIRYTNVRINVGEATKNLCVRFIPLPEKKGQEPLLAVFFEEVKETTGGKPTVTDQSSYDLDKEAAQRIQDLEQDLQFTKENLQATIEELETSNEELQATNEELLASNEELQSTNEELQSVNEELFTVNAEYQSKIIELTELNNDVENMLDSTQIGFLLLDENLDVRKFSPKVTTIFNILENDVGRSIHHVSHNVSNLNPIEKIQDASKDLSESVNYEIQTREGDWHLMRIMPYRIGPDVSSGLVVSFINTTRIKQYQTALQDSEERFKHLFEQAGDAIFLIDHKGRFVNVNQRACEVLGYTKQELLQLSVPDIDPLYPKEAFEDFFRGLEFEKPITVEAVHRRKDGSTFPVEIRTGLISLDETPHVLSIARNISERKQGEQSLKEREEIFRGIFEQAAIGIARLSPQGHMLDVNQKLGEMLGGGKEKWFGQPIDSIVRPEDRASLQQIKQKLLDGQMRNNVLTCRLENGDTAWRVNLTLSLIRTHDGNSPYFLAMIQPLESS